MPRSVLVRGAVPVLNPGGRLRHMRARHMGGESGRSARVALGLAAVAVVLGAARLEAAEQKIAVVDMQRALNECDAGKRAKDQVKAKFERSQNQLKKQREDLDRMKDDYDRKALVLKDEERRNLEKDLETRGLEFKRKYEDFQRDLKRTDAELTSSIVEELYGIVRDYGQKNGYSLVLEASSGPLLYNDKAGFRRPVLPGDTLRLEVTCKPGGPPWRLRGVATSDGAVVAEVDFTAAPRRGIRIHPTAAVAPGAELAPGVTIEAYAVVGPD